MKWYYCANLYVGLVCGWVATYFSIVHNTNFIFWAWLTIVNLILVNIVKEK